MKNFKNLYPKIGEFNNLLIAWKQARKGKRCTSAAAAFEQNLDLELVALSEHLRDETYQPGRDC